MHIIYPLLPKLLVFPFIPFDIVFYFLIPISKIRFRFTEASRTAMPEASIDEDGEMPPREIDIRSARNFPSRAIPTDAHGPDIFPESNLDARILAPDTGHEIAPLAFSEFIHDPDSVVSLYYMEGLPALKGIANGIAAKDKVLGYLAVAAIKAAETENYIAALASSFLLVEQAIRFSCDDDGNGELQELLNRLVDEKKISGAEAGILDEFRFIRNKISHASHYGWAFVDSGLIWQFSEEETWEELWASRAIPIFEILGEMFS
jgi:hypothetical protein